jgi:hypothetical protein
MRTNLAGMVLQLTSLYFPGFENSSFKVKVTPKTKGSPQGSPVLDQK